MDDKILQEDPKGLAKYLIKEINSLKQKLSQIQNNSIDPDDSRSLKNYRGAYSSNYLNKSNYGSTDKIGNPYPNPQLSRYCYSSVNNHDARNNNRRETAQTTLYPTKQASGSQPRIQSRGNFGIHNNKTRYNYYRPNWDLNSRYEKSKYEPEEMRTSSISNEK